MNAAMKDAPIAHTPGPWAVDREAGTIFHPASGARLAFIGRVSSFEVDANARLIAAAPDLLTALRQLERAVSAKCAHQLHAPLGIAPEFHDLYAQVVQARAAIDKAEGHG